jgi:hypothetical protein
VRLLYKQRGTLDKDNRRLHQNNRLNEVINFFMIFKKKNLIIRRIFKYRKRHVELKAQIRFSTKMTKNWRIMIEKNF